jgi:hypothetical protein
LLEESSKSAIASDCAFANTGRIARFAITSSNSVTRRVFLSTFCLINRRSSLQFVVIIVIPFPSFQMP